MASSNSGKDEVCAWIRKNFPANSTAILDVGACDGKWKTLLPEYTMDAVEAFGPHCVRIAHLYREVFNQDVAELEYGYYNLIIFGDVIEHMDVQTAQRVIKYAWPRCRDLIVGVPYLYPQGAFGGNPWEEHKQPDLTAEIFAERYPQLEVLIRPSDKYCYYHKPGGAS